MTSLNPYSDGTTKIIISHYVSPDKSGFVRLSIPLHCVCTMQVSLKILILMPVPKASKRACE